MAFQFRRPDTAFSLDPKPDKKQRRIKDEGHLSFIRKLPSVISGQYGCEACHIRAGNPVFRKPNTGAGVKPDDAWTVPLTPEEHRDQHSGNEMQFWARHGVDPFMVALSLYQNTGDFEAAKRVLVNVWASKTASERRE